MQNTALALKIRGSETDDESLTSHMDTPCFKCWDNKVNRHFLFLSCNKQEYTHEASNLRNWLHWTMLRTLMITKNTRSSYVTLRFSIILKTLARRRIRRGLGFGQTWHVTLNAAGQTLATNINNWACSSVSLEASDIPNTATTTILKATAFKINWSKLSLVVKFL